jgi:predicted aminopeptidase
LLLLLPLIMEGSGCTPLYVLRAAYEESRILFRREPIEQVLEARHLDPAERAKLELVLDVRRFARERLGLEVAGAYSSFAVVDRGAIVQVLSAAEMTRLEPYRWWFPIVGSVDYKGFFRMEEAEAEATRLHAKGYDTYIRPAGAFSTLGWFDDPVLSSWLAWEPGAIVETLLHELLHRTYYLPGQTTFNESLANFVGHRGAIAYFAERDGPTSDATAAAETDWRHELDVAQRLGEAKARLTQIYSHAPQDRPASEALLEERHQVFDDLVAALRGQAPARPMRPALELNNAVLLSLLNYTTDLDRFEAIWHATGNDLRATIQRIASATEHAEDPFAALAGLATPADEPSDHRAGRLAPDLVPDGSELAAQAAP